MPIFWPGRSYYYNGPLSPQLLEEIGVSQIDVLEVDMAETGVKELRQTLLQALERPFGTHRLLWLHQAEQASEVIQNTLLKLLEEPPKALIIVLNAARIDSFLPTIRSRLHRVDAAALPSSHAKPLASSPAELERQLRAVKDRSVLTNLFAGELEQTKARFLSLPSPVLRQRLELLERSINRLRHNVNQKLVIDGFLLRFFPESGKE